MVVVPVEVKTADQRIKNQWRFRFSQMVTYFLCPGN